MYNICCFFKAIHTCGGRFPAIEDCWSTVVSQRVLNQTACDTVLLQQSSLKQKSSDELCRKLFDLWQRDLPIGSGHEVRLGRKTEMKWVWSDGCVGLCWRKGRKMQSWESYWDWSQLAWWLKGADRDGLDMLNIKMYRSDWINTVWWWKLRIDITRHVGHQKTCLNCVKEDIKFWSVLLWLETSEEWESSIHPAKPCLTGKWLLKLSMFSLYTTIVFSYTLLLFWQNSDYNSLPLKTWLLDIQLIRYVFICILICIKLLLNVIS